MAADAGLTDRIDQLIDLFNHRSMDLPDGLFDRQTQFLLNGTPFEELLGRNPGDPLVLMLTRGGAGYRFAVKALQHAMPDIRVERGDIEALEGVVGGPCVVPLWLSGHLRGTGEAVETVTRVRVVMGGRGPVATANIDIEGETVTLLRQARLRE